MSAAERELKKEVSITSHADSPVVLPTDFPLARGLSPEERKKVEKKLKLKLDLRNSVFVLIYIMSTFGKIHHLHWLHWLTNRLPRPKQLGSCQTRHNRGRPRIDRDQVLDMSLYASLNALAADDALTPVFT